MIWRKAGRGDVLPGGLAELVAAGRQGVVWLVPEPYSHACERILAGECGPQACLFAEVLTFGRLCDRVLAAEGGLSRPVLDAGGRLLTLKLAVDDVREHLAHFSRAARGHEMLEGLMAAIDECKCYGITAAALGAAAAVADERAAGRLSELSLILAAFEARCAAGAADPRDRYDILADKLSAGNWAEGRTVFVTHFASFTPQERRVLRALAERCESFSIRVTGDPNDDGFSHITRTVRLLTRGADGARLTVEDLAPASPGSLLDHVSQSWLDPSAGAFEGDADAVELWRAPGAAAECRHAAERIRRLVREDGMRFRDIAVICSDFDVYGPLLSAIFPQYSVPLFSDAMDDSSQKPLPELIRAAADCVSFGYRPEDVTALVRTGLAGVTPDEADRLEDYIFLWNIRGSRFSGRTPWSRPPGGYGSSGGGDGEALAGLERVRRHILGGLSCLRGGTCAALRCAEKLCSCLEALGVPAELEKKIAALEAAGEGKLALEAAQMWDIFCDSLEQCAAALGDGELGMDEFAGLLELVMKGRPVGSIPPSLDGVTAGDISRAARLPARALIILGASEDRLPARGAAASLLGAEERDALAAAGAELPPGEIDRVERGLFDIYTAVSMPSERLIISYPLSETGEDLPSSAVTRAAALSGAAVRDIPPSDFPSRRPVVKPSREALPPEVCRSLYGRTLMLSASRVEAFQSCAFAYFCRYGLKVGKKREPGLRPPDVGMFVHYVLEKTAMRVMSAGGFREVSVSAVRDIAAECSDEYIRMLLRGADDPPARTAAHMASLRRAARDLAENMALELADSAFEPLRFEARLDGGEEPIGGAPAGAPDSMRVVGKADRVDGYMHNGTLYVRVVDYKTGAKGFSLRDVYHGIGIQMLLYLFRLTEAEAARLGAGKALPAGVLYVPAHEAVVRAYGPVSAGEAESLIARRLRRSGLLLDEAPVLRAMEKSLEDEGRFIPIKFNRDGSQAARNSVASAARMGLLSRHVDGILRRMAAGVASGDVAANPIRKSRSERACDLCDYRAACLYDPEEDGETRMADMDAEKVFELLEESRERGGGAWQGD